MPTPSIEVLLPLSGYIFSFNVWKSVCIRFDYTTKTLYYFPVMHIKSFRVIYVGHCNSKIYLTIIDKRFSVKQISSWPNNRKWRLYMQILPGAILLTQKRGNQVKGSLSGVHSMQTALYTDISKDFFFISPKKAKTSYEVLFTRALRLRM